MLCHAVSIARAFCYDFCHRTGRSCWLTTGALDNLFLVEADISRVAARDEWLASIGLAERIPLFREQKITADQLGELTEDDLRELGLTIGERRRFQRAVESGSPVGAPTASAPPEAQGPSLAEHRPLTVMFADLIDSTGLGERLDAEDLREVVRLYREFCGGAIGRYGGRIARFLGDGILAYFCHPVANENDPERAVRAAIDIVRDIGALNTPAGQELQVRIGLATGRVLISDLFAGGGADDDTIIGPCANLAARLQALAPPNGIIIAERTHRRVATRFECEALGFTHLRGFEQPHDLWRVLGERSLRKRLGDGEPAQTESSFVGREAELELMHILWKRAGHGEGAAVLLTGEAGIGKSRLVRHFLEGNVEGDAATMRIAASAFDENSALRPFVDHLRDISGLTPADGPDEARAKVGALLDGRTTRREEAVAILSGLVGLPTSNAAVEGFAPTQLRERTITLLVDLFVAAAAVQPLCLVVEDLHWLDPTSRDVVERLVDHVRSHPILLILTARDDQLEHWRGRIDATLRIGRLSPELVAGMVKALWGRDLIERIVRQVVERTDGVPLFVEEVTRALIQSSQPEDVLEQAVPASLEETLMARLDRSGVAKQIAQVASVIGRSARRDVLAAASDLPGDRFDNALAALVRLGILERAHGSDAETYQFHHALLRDTAYSSLLRDHRRELHRRVAQVIAAIDPAAVALHPDVLAQHLTGAGLVEDAAPHWLEAARRSFARSALVEGTQMLRRLAADLARLTQSEAIIRLRVQVSALLGPALIGLKGASAPETKELYTTAYELCQQLPDEPSHFPVYWGWWRISPYSPERAPALLSLAQTWNDPELLLEAHHCSWAVHFHLGDLTGCRYHMQEGLSIYDASDYRHHARLYGNHDPKVCAHGNLSQLYWMEGKLRRALDEEVKSLSWAQSLDHIGSRVHAMGLTLLHRVYRRDFREVYERSAQLLAFTEEHGIADHGAAGLIFQGWVSGIENDPAAGLRVLQEGLLRQRETATDEDLSVYLCLQAELLMKLGRADEAVELIERERPGFEQSRLWIWYPELLRVLGDATHMAEPRNTERARRLLRQASDLAQDQNVPMLSLRIALSEARLNQDARDPETSRNAIRAALDRISEPDSSLDLSEAKRYIAPMRDRPPTVHPNH